MFKFILISVVVLFIAFRFAPDATQKVLDYMKGYSQTADISKVTEAGKAVGAVILSGSTTK